MTNAGGLLCDRERRQKPRFNIRLQVIVVAEHQGVKRPYGFVTRNISETGLFIFGGPQDFAPQPGETLLDMTLTLGEEEEDITLVAEIMHQIGGPGPEGFGVKIVEIAPEAQQRLTDFIADFAAKNPDSLDE